MTNALVTSGGSSAGARTEPVSIAKEGEWSFERDCRLQKTDGGQCSRQVAGTAEQVVVVAHGGAHRADVRASGEMHREYLDFGEESATSVTLTFAGWNHIGAWLRRLAILSITFGLQNQRPTPLVRTDTAAVYNR
jgi:hypothetical protein